MERDASRAEEDAEDDMFVNVDEPTKEINAILHPIAGAQQELRYFIMLVLQHQIARHLPRSLSSSRTGMRWRETLAQYWDRTIQLI